MKIIFNRLIPFHGFVAMAVYGVIFWRDEYRLDYSIECFRNRVINHESIHMAQMKDFCKWLPIGGTIFYIVYFLEWLYRLVTGTNTAYRSISFEKEARAHEYEPDYLSTRKRFAMWRKS